RKVLVRNMTDNVQPADLLACGGIHPAEEFFGAKITNWFRQVDDEILRIEVVSHARIGGVVRNQNIGEWSCSVCNVDPPVEPQKQFTDQSVNCGRRFVFWIWNAIFALIGASCVYTSEIGLVINQ